MGARDPPLTNVGSAANFSRASSSCSSGRSVTASAAAFAAASSAAARALSSASCFRLSSVARCEHGTLSALHRWCTHASGVYLFRFPLFGNGSTTCSEFTLALCSRIGFLPARAHLRSIERLCCTKHVPYFFAAAARSAFAFAAAAASAAACAAAASAASAAAASAAAAAAAAASASAWAVAVALVPAADELASLAVLPAPSSSLSLWWPSSLDSSCWSWDSSSDSCLCCASSSRRSSSCSRRICTAIDGEASRRFNEHSTQPRRPPCVCVHPLRGVAAQPLGQRPPELRQQQFLVQPRQLHPLAAGVRGPQPAASCGWQRRSTDDTEESAHNLVATLPHHGAP